MPYGKAVFLWHGEACTIGLSLSRSFIQGRTEAPQSPPQNLLLLLSVQYTRFWLRKFITVWSIWRIRSTSLQSQHESSAQLQPIFLTVSQPPLSSRSPALYSLAPNPRAPQRPSTFPFLPRRLLQSCHPGDYPLPWRRTPAYLYQAAGS